MCQIKKFNWLFSQTVQQETTEVNPFLEFFVLLPGSSFLKEIAETEEKQKIPKFDSTKFWCSFLILYLSNYCEPLKKELTQYWLLDQMQQTIVLSFKDEIFWSFKAF